MKSGPKITVMGYEYRIEADDVSEGSLAVRLARLPFYSGREGGQFTYDRIPKCADQPHEFIVYLEDKQLYILHQGKSGISAQLLGLLIQCLLGFNERVVITEL